MRSKQFALKVKNEYKKSDIWNEVDQMHDMETNTMLYIEES
jgi:hypothetical protein